jgi:hypothetical protein
MVSVNLLAQLWGFAFILVGLAFLVNQKHVAKVMAFMEDEGRIVISGIAGTVLGLLLVLNYNVWTGGWNVLVTILGWAFLAKGVIRLFFPQFVLGMIAKCKSNASWMPIFFLAMVLVGCFLAYAGYSM